MSGTGLNGGASPAHAGAAVGRDPFADILPGQPCYEIKLAQRIAEVEDLAHVEAMLPFVPRDCYRMVETLAIQGIALRIVGIAATRDSDYERELAKLRRRQAFEKLPADLQPRVEALARSYFKSNPKKILKRARDE